jgi:quinol monooxygenase YgiN
MTQSDGSLVLLTVRGMLAPKSIDAARKLHNETAGSPQGIAAARALGDLSHKVYLPVTKAPGTKEGELLFIDTWLSAEGIGKFFSNPHVQEQGSHLFSSRDPIVWMPARGAFSFNLPAPTAKGDRYLGVVQGPVKSPEQAIQTFRDVLAPRLSDARRRGQLSHEIYFRMPMPGEKTTPELFGIDVWCDAEGMQEHYRELKGLEPAFAGAPQMSVWEAPEGGGWSEW